MIGATVWVVHIEHRFGYNLTVHTTYDGASEELSAFARHWWSEWVDEPIPDNDDEIIETYFDRASGEESYTLDATRVAA